MNENGEKYTNESGVHEQKQRKDMINHIFSRGVCEYYGQNYLSELVKVDDLISMVYYDSTELDLIVTFGKYYQRNIYFKVIFFISIKAID